ncbi:hypothetical protein [Niallia taxi]|uniref:hypothetical protein n=1 Tax=Niallia taxi TaxID=2499688 RepID=UPI0011A6E0B4
MNILTRKIISASISGTIFAILLGFIIPDPFGDININTIQTYLLSSISIIPAYFMYSFPVILIYGVVTSIISDKVGESLANKTKDDRTEFIISGALHIVFGLILFLISLGAAVIFFTTDRIIRKRRKTYNWLDAIKSLAIPVIAFLLFLGIVWINDIFLT